MIEINKDIFWTHDEELDIDYKCYLTIEELELIVEQMLKYQKYTERLYVKNLMILKHCTNIDIEKYEYDELLVAGIIDKVNSRIVNIDEIDKAVKYSESIESSARKFFEELTKTVKKYSKNLPKEDSMNKLIEVFNKFNEEKIKDDSKRK